MSDPALIKDPDLPKGWNWYVCTYTREGKAFGLTIPAESWAAAEAAMAEWTGDGVVDGVSHGRIPGGFGDAS